MMVVLLVSVVSTTTAYAEKIKKVHPRGVLELADGTRVALAGIEVADEAGPVLATLLAAGDADVEYADAAPTEKISARPAYLFVEAKSLERPFKTNASAEARRVMVNEFLLSEGVAKVDEKNASKYKPEFLKAEASARERGNGIWSYAPPTPKKVEVPAAPLEPS